MLKEIFLSFLLASGADLPIQEESTNEVESQEADSAIPEPAIYGQWLNDTMTIANYKTSLHPFFINDDTITTVEGRKLFKVEEDGLLVRESGLYRISFFQKVGTLDGECKLILYVDEVHSGPIREQEIHLVKGKNETVQISQLFRLNAGSKIRISMAAYNGQAKLIHGYNVSGFTVEAVRK